MPGCGTRVMAVVLCSTAVTAGAVSQPRFLRGAALLAQNIGSITAANEMSNTFAAAIWIVVGGKTHRGALEVAIYAQLC